MAGPTDLYDLAFAYLLDCADALDTIPDADPTLEGAPVRQYVSPGIPVADFVGADCCTQLAVNVTGPQEQGTTPDGMDAGRRAARYGWVNEVTLVAYIYRCIPSGDSSIQGYTPPTVAELNQSSKQHLADNWALWNHLHNLVHAEHLVSLCDQVFFDGLIDQVPSGGCAGWTCTIRAALEGYEELIGS